VTKLSRRILEEVAEWSDVPIRRITWELTTKMDWQDDDIRLQTVTGGYLCEYLSDLVPSQLQDSEAKNKDAFERLEILLSWLSAHPSLVELIIQGAGYKHLMSEIRWNLAAELRTQNATRRKEAHQ